MHKDCEMLNEIRKITQMGCFGIQAVLPQSSDAALTKALKTQLTEYERIGKEADALLRAHGGKEKNLPPMVKYANAMTSKLRTRLADDPNGKIAEMMLQGNTRGMVKSIRSGRTLPTLDPKVACLSARLLQTEQENIDCMKLYL